MALSFLEKLKDLKMTSLAFTSFDKRMTLSDEGAREAYLVFELADPIAKVVGHSVEYNPDDNSDTVPIAQRDVTHVKCMMRLIEEYAEEFVFDFDGDGDLTRSGKYHGDMFLDVARSGDVWLTDNRLSKYGQDKRKERRTERFKIMQKLNES